MQAIKFFTTLILLCTVSQLSGAIRGPKSFDDKIVIVGAGVSGVHMALLLKERGFKDVQIFEKTVEIGGKSETITYRGAAHEMGTCYVSPDYKDIMALVKKYVPRDLIPFPSASIWLDDLPGPITYQQYIARYALNYLQTRNITVAKMAIVRAILKYNRLHRGIFGEYEGELMPRPNAEKMALIKGTFLDYLRRNGLELLVPVFEASTTVQGYGYVHKIAALYGLMWNTPNFMTAFLTRMESDNKKAGMYILKSGFQNLWRTIIKVEGIKVVYNVTIHEVFRMVDNNWNNHVFINKTQGNGSSTMEYFHFGIWSPEMKTSLKFWNAMPQEKRIFSATSPNFFTSSLVNYVKGMRGFSPIDYWLDKIKNNVVNSMWAQRDTYAVMNGHKGALYKNGTYPSGSDKKPVKTIIAYQMAEHMPNKNELKGALINQIESIGGLRVAVLKSKTWRYFPRYSPKDIEDGVLWDIVDMQGKYALWYIGSSVCFESIKSVVQYNKMLIRELKMPKEIP